MKKFKPLDVILFAQFILFLVLWAVDEDTKIAEQINGVIFVVLFFVNLFLRLKGKN
jgi:hypothetical protein